MRSSGSTVGEGKKSSLRVSSAGRPPDPSVATPSGTTPHFGAVGISTFLFPSFLWGEGLSLPLIFLELVTFKSAESRVRFARPNGRKDRATKRARS